MRLIIIAIVLASYVFRIDGKSLVKKNAEAQADDPTTPQQFRDVIVSKLRKRQDIVVEPVNRENDGRSCTWAMRCDNPNRIGPNCCHK